MTWSKQSDLAPPKKAVFSDRSPPKKAAPSWLASPKVVRPRSEKISLRPGAPGVGRADDKADASDAAPIKMLSRPARGRAEQEQERSQDLAHQLEHVRAHDRERKAEYERAVVALEKAVEDIATLRQRVLSMTEHQLAELATAIARKVVGRE